MQSTSKNPISPTHPSETSNSTLQTQTFPTIPSIHVTVSQSKEAMNRNLDITTLKTQPKPPTAFTSPRGSLSSIHRLEPPFMCRMGSSGRPSSNSSVNKIAQQVVKPFKTTIDE
jgi:hypothetical protein